MKIQFRFKHFRLLLNLAIFCICFDCSHHSRLTLGWVCGRKQLYSLQTKKKKKDLPYLMAIIENARCSRGWVMKGSESEGERGAWSCILMSVGVLDKENPGGWPCPAHCGVLQQSQSTQTSLGRQLACYAFSRCPLLGAGPRPGRWS